MSENHITYEKSTASLQGILCKVRPKLVIGEGERSQRPMVKHRNRSYYFSEEEKRNGEFGVADQPGQDRWARSRQMGKVKTLVKTQEEGES